MKRFIKTTVFFSVLAVMTIYSKRISDFVVVQYNQSVAYLASNVSKTSNQLGF